MDKEKLIKLINSSKSNQILVKACEQLEEGEFYEISEVEHIDFSSEASAPSGSITAIVLKVCQ